MDPQVTQIALVGVKLAFATAVLRGAGRTLGPVVEKRWPRAHKILAMCGVFVLGILPDIIQAITAANAAAHKPNSPNEGDQ